MGEFRMPSLGADMEAGTLVEWKVKPGDRVRHGDIIAVVETQKGAIDVEVFEDGVVSQILVQPGQKVPVGTVLAVLGGEGAAVEAPPRRRVSPVARKRAQELGVDLSRVEGTGPGGAAGIEDVERAAGKAAPPSEAPREQPLVAMRRAIAAAMARSKREIPHYYLSARIDLGAAKAWLEAENRRRSVAERVLPAALLLKAVAVALREVPELNGHFVDGAFRPSRVVHAGVAISLRQGGLVAPALHEVDQLPLGVLMPKLADLIQRARAGTLRSSELADATVTVTNLGEVGVDSVFGVIYPPQVALVGFGRVGEHVGAKDGRVVIRPSITATLAADHRASDGHRGGRFLATLDRLLQTPERL